MAKRRTGIVIEDLTQEMLNDERDAQRRVLERMTQPFRQELEKRARKHVNRGQYADSMFSEVDDNALILRGGSTDPVAILIEKGTGPRSTGSGAGRGVMPKDAVIRKSALAIRRKVYDEVERELRNV